MQTLKRVSAFFLAIGLASMLGCAGSPTTSSTLGYVDDTLITTKVKAAFLREESLKAAEINVETFKGAVQLSGFVRYQADINRAVIVAGEVGGVTSVKHDMRLK